jgi:hypothetical protein
MTKKRSPSQRIGELGEDTFQFFARKRGLIPTKIPNDYGIDFFCQLTKILPNGHESVLPSSIAVNVRSSDQKRIRAKYSRDDIKLLLKSEFPMLLILVDIRNNKVYHKFLDKELMEFFYSELLKGAKYISIIYKEMSSSDEDFHRSLSLITTIRYREMLRLRAAELRLSQIIGPSRLQVHRFSEGSLAVVEVRNFEDIFKHQEDKIKSKVREVLLTSRLDRGFSLPTEHLNRAIVDEIGDFAEKIAVITKIHSKPEKLFVKSDENVVECIFEVRPLGDEFSFYHVSGLSIIFSGPRKGEEGLHYHNFEVKYNDLSSEPMFNHKEIISFLKNCKENTTIHLGDIESIGFELKYFPMLIRLGLIVSSLETIYTELKIDRPLIKLLHIDDPEFQLTFAFIANLFNPYLKENIWPGFLISPEDIPMKWVDGKIFCPVFFTLPEGKFIIIVSFDGKIALLDDVKEEIVAGFRFDPRLCGSLGHRSQKTVLWASCPGKIPQSLFS